ncbi:alanine racemase [Pleionea sediminis]|uniref:alanine racemase n=1 Tax=Pleionea sediminis TaxID=2569479 RepID=UPI0011855D07|nr:alanine racemase [Pleionea sediminis]
MRPTQAIISLNALGHNLSMIRQMAPKSKIMAVVKADGYGHGIVKVAKQLTEADSFAVACLEEAIQLREGEITQPIVLLEGIFEASELELVERYNLEMVIHSQRQLVWLEDSASQYAHSVWLKLDSDMNRLGFTPEEYSAAYKHLSDMKNVANIRLMTHFACADDVTSDKTNDQLKLFHQLNKGIKGERTAANSAGVLAWPESHFDWVRPGIMLYGCSPLSGQAGAHHQLIPAMNLESQLIATKKIEKGHTAGYGAQWTADEDTMLGIVAIGYGDGYPRHAENGTPVWINGRIVPLAGRVSMDMIAVDLGADATEKPGERVVLWGKELPVEIVARHSDTIPYTLLCGVTSRAKFRWSDES